MVEEEGKEEIEVVEPKEEAEKPTTVQENGDLN